MHVPLPWVIEMGEGDMSGLEALFKTQSTLSKAPPFFCDDQQCSGGGHSICPVSE